MINIPPETQSYCKGIWQQLCEKHIDTDTIAEKPFTLEYFKEAIQDLFYAKEQEKLKMEEELENSKVLPDVNP